MPILQLPLSKVSAYRDFRRFPTAYYEQVFKSNMLEGQHAMRLWEYCMALGAIDEWQHETGRLAEPLRLLDVGGGNSRFCAGAVDTLPHGSVGGIVDPVGGSHGYLMTATELVAWAGGRLADIVTCISVLEHVEHLQETLAALAELVKPGGLLFLTADYHPNASSVGSDRWHFHWMRKRIFDLTTWAALRDTFYVADLHIFGGWDVVWYGPTVYDYGFVSMALRKGE